MIKNTENLLYPDVVETIRKLSEKCRLSIVSNCQRGYIELFMGKTGTEKYITDYECFGNTRKSKGENIKLVMERNNLDDVIYVGDTQGDYEAAAGLRVGDVITHINGEEVNTLVKFKSLLYSLNPGDIITVKYINNNTENSVDIKLAEMPEEFR